MVGIALACVLLAVSLATSCWKPVYSHNKLAMCLILGERALQKC